jgi:hypothetical protein
MTDIDSSLTRRSALFAAAASLLQTSTLFAGEKSPMMHEHGDTMKK